MQEFPQGLPFLQTGPLLFFELLLLELGLLLRANAGALKSNDTAIAATRIARIESPSVAEIAAHCQKRRNSTAGMVLELSAD
jgi:hypothetical protein